MKNVRTTIAKAVAMVALASAAGFAAAADSQTLSVTASVDALCKFSSAPATLAFGAIDPSGTVDKTATVNVLYKCTKGTPSAGVSPASGGTARTMTGTGAGNTLAYTLAFVGGTQTGAGFGSGKDLTLAVNGTITPTQFQNAAADSYSESVTLNITP